MDIVMCNPKYYDITYELSTNRWMSLNNKPDKELALEQWETLYTNYLVHGVNIREIDPAPDLGSMTFVADAGLMFNNNFILSNFYHSRRCLEYLILYNFFSKHMGTDNIHILPYNFCFEGQGDALFLSNKLLLIGYGIRTSLSGAERVAEILKRIDSTVEIIFLPLKTIENYLPNEKIYYHLNTCLFYFPKKQTFLVYPDAFQKEALAKLSKLGGIINLNSSEAASFIANSVIIDDETIFTPVLKHEKIREILKSFKYYPIENNMSEFMKSGESVRSLSFQVPEDMKLFKNMDVAPS